MVDRELPDTPRFAGRRARSGARRGPGAADRRSARGDRPPLHCRPPPRGGRRSPSARSERSRRCSTGGWRPWAVSSRPRPTLTVVMTNLTPDPISPEHAELAARLAALGKESVDPAGRVGAPRGDRRGAGGPNRPSGSGALRARQSRRRVCCRPVARRHVTGVGGRAREHPAERGGGRGRARRPRPARRDSPFDRRLRRQDLQEPRSVRVAGRRSALTVRQALKSGTSPARPRTRRRPRQGGTKKAGGTDKGCGKPPWAGKGNHAKKTPEAVAQRKAACGDDKPKTTPAPRTRRRRRARQRRRRDPRA